MEKKRYEIEIAGVQLAIISDEREEFVNSVVETIDKEIRDITVATKRSSNLDAAILCAIQYYSDKVKAEKRSRNLEAQIALYDANLRRFREENLALKNKLDGAEASEKTAQNTEPEQKAEEPAEEKAEAVTEKADDETVETKDEVKEEPAEDSSRAARLRAIEELLGRGGKKD